MNKNFWIYPYTIKEIKIFCRISTYRILFEEQYIYYSSFNKTEIEQIIKMLNIAYNLGRHNENITKSLSI